jgi:hypothetical protein
MMYSGNGWPAGVFMKRRFSAIVLSFAFPAAVAFAHGDKKHVLGTIEKVDSGSVTVKTRDGKSVEVKLVASTVYISHAGSVDKPATISDLAVGKTVVIHATPKGEELEADEVKFSSGAARAPAPKS